MLRNIDAASERANARNSRLKTQLKCQAQSRKYPMETSPLWDEYVICFYRNPSSWIEAASGWIYTNFLQQVCQNFLQSVSESAFEFTQLLVARTVDLLA